MYYGHIHTDQPTIQSGENTVLPEEGASIPLSAGWSTSFSPGWNTYHTDKYGFEFNYPLGGYNAIPDIWESTTTGEFSAGYSYSSGRDCMVKFVVFAMDRNYRGKKDLGYCPGRVEKVEQGKDYSYHIVYAPDLPDAVQSLESFRIISQNTAEWKAYKNEKYGFEFQYPNYYAQFSMENPSMRNAGIFVDRSGINGGGYIRYKDILPAQTSLRAASVNSSPDLYFHIFNLNEYRFNGLGVEYGYDVSQNAWWYDQANGNGRENFDPPQINGGGWQGFKFSTGDAGASYVAIAIPLKERGIMLEFGFSYDQLTEEQIPREEILSTLKFSKSTTSTKNFATRSSAYVYAPELNKVKVSLVSDDEEMKIGKGEFCGSSTGMKEYKGHYKLVLDPKTATSDNPGGHSDWEWKYSEIDLGELSFNDGTSWDGSLEVDNLDPNGYKNFIILKQYASCNGYNVSIFGYDMETGSLMRYKFAGPGVSVKDTLFVSDMKKSKDGSFFTSSYNNATGNWENMLWVFDPSAKVFQPAYNND